MFVTGCGDNTAILLEVTSAGNTVISTCHYLRFYIGAQDPDLAINTNRTIFVGNPGVAEKIILKQGRDIGTDPYRLLLHDGVSRHDQFAVAVGCFDEADTLISYAVLPEPIGFISGQVSKWPLPLQNADDAATIGETGCFDYETETQEILINSQQDMDCDGDPSDLDCDDFDPLLGTTVKERCDGRDNDCDETTSFPHPTGLCYLSTESSSSGSGPAEQRCFIGDRICSEANNTTGAWEPCRPNELADNLDKRSAVLDEMCSQLEGACANTKDPFLCANLRSVTEEHECKVYFCAEPGGMKPCYQPTIDLPNPGGATDSECRWTLAPFQSYGDEWNGLEIAAPGGVGGHIFDGCEARLRINPNIVHPVSLAEESFVIHVNVDRVATKAIRLKLKPEVVDTPDGCPGTQANPEPAIECPTLVQ